MPKHTLPLWFAVTLIIAACASTGGPDASSRFGEITAAEVKAATTTSDAYLLIQKLRPNWLRQRGVSSINNPSPRVVYMDNMRLGGLGSLRQIPVASIERIRFLDSREATQRFGTGHVNGVILIFSR